MLISKTDVGLINKSQNGYLRMPQIPEMAW